MHRGLLLAALLLAASWGWGCSGDERTASSEGRLATSRIDGSPRGGSLAQADSVARRQEMLGGQHVPRPTRLVDLEPGLQFPACLQERLSTRTARTGDVFILLTENPVRVGGIEAIPPGTTVMGRVVRAERAAGAVDAAGLWLEFDELRTPDGRRHPIVSRTLTLDRAAAARADSEAAGSLGVSPNRGDIVLDPGIDLTVTLAQGARIAVESDAAGEPVSGP